MEAFLAFDPDVICERTGLGFYDYIIVGSGFGGGVLAEQLVQQRRRVLLIERGGPMFSTHVLNLPRPDYVRGRDDSPEGNEIVYAAVKQTIQTAENSEPYVGGPIYCLGGRSNVWGLWIPEADKDTLRQYFPAEIVKWLLEDGGFKNAFNLLTNMSQTEAVYPLGGHIPEEEVVKATEALTLGIKDYLKKDEKIHVGPIASEFISPAPYRFPTGAFSTTTPLLNRVFARDEFLTILMNTEVLQVTPADNAETTHISSITIRSNSDRRVCRLAVPQQTRVILSAGTLGSATIALNSGLHFRKNTDLIGKGLIDHEVWALRFAKERDYQKSTDPLILQCMINILGTTALLTVTVNANYLLSSAAGSRVPISQYLGKEGKIYNELDGKLKFSDSGDSLDTMQILLEYHAELDDENEVLPVATPDPVIRIRRRYNTHTDEASQVVMQQLATIIRDSFRDPQVIPLPGPGVPQEDPAARMQLLGFGVFAHEVGTMRMPSPNRTKASVVDENLKVHGFTNLHVCDLSVMPVSIESNPSLTLTGIILKLAKYFEMNPKPELN